jgi:hypothetical protein
MAHNPYAPPIAGVIDIELPSDTATEPPFFAVSLVKLSVMNLCTFNLYEVYWFYKHWQRISEREREPMWPLMRAIFALFYCYQCFARIRDHESAAEWSSRLPAVPLAVGFIATTLTWRLPEPFSWITMVAFVFLLPVQAYANRLNAQVAPSHDRNTRFTAWNWIAVLVGGSLLLLVIAGIFLPLD